MPALPFGLSFVDGRGVVTLTQRRATGPVGLERLELEIPNLRFPFDISGGASHFRHRRCRLRRAELRCDEQAATRWLASRVERASFGFGELSVSFHPGVVELTGAVTIADERAEFLFRGFVQPIEGRRVRVCLCDLRLFGPFPVSAPLLAGGLLQATGAEQAENSTEVDPGVKLLGATDVLFDPLALTLLHTLPPHGWRLPAQRGVRVASLQTFVGRLEAGYVAEDDPAASSGGTTVTPSKRFVAMQEAKGLFSAVEGQILTTDSRELIELYRRHHRAHPHHPFIRERLLQLMSAETTLDGETLEFARETLRRARATSGRSRSRSPVRRSSTRPS